jgi:PBSX family phage portal protein
MANIVKARILGAEEGAVDAVGRSTQLPEDTWDYNKTGAKEPPYNLDALCVFLEINTWHYRCVKAKAISTAGLGFDFVAPEGVKEPKPENKQVLKEFFNHPNDEMTWGEILENVLTDFEALGNGYFEVVRNRFGAGRPTAIYHIPAVTMRVRKDKKGFVQQRDNRMVYFRNFGSDPKDPDSFDPRDKDKPPEKRRLLNEVIHLKNYHPRSSYYGLPDFLPALRALVGNKKAGDFNITFFENNAVPQYAIIVKGGELARGTRKRIEEYFRTHIKGNAHKTLILEVVQDEGEKVDIEIKPLAVDIKDASFRMFRADNAEEIRVAHGVPGRLIGLAEKGGLGGAGEGETQQEIFKYHVIEPKQTRLEYRINNFLVKRGFGIEDWELRFKEIDVTDEAKVAEIIQKLVKLGVLTINEGRREMGQKPLEHPGADVPFMMTAMGPLSLDTLAQGGVRPPMMPADTGKALIDSLLTLQDVIREEIRKRAEEPPAESEGEVPSLSQAGGNGR